MVPAPRAGRFEVGTSLTPRFAALSREENFFAHLKQFRGIATRYCKLVSRFIAFLCLAGWFLISKGE